MPESGTEFAAPVSDSLEIEGLRAGSPLTDGGGGKKGTGRARAAFTAWLGRQSLPRLLGLLVGNTRDLERLLEASEAARERERAEYATEIARLRNEAEAREGFFRDRFRELSDSALLNKGMLPASPEAREAALQGKATAVERKNSPKQMEIEVEADRLLEMLEYGDYVRLEERLVDLDRSGLAMDQRILKRYFEKEQKAFRRAPDADGYTGDAEEGMGVVVGPAGVGGIQ